MYIDDAILAFKQAVDPENKLYILIECIEKIDQIPENLDSELSHISSILDKLSSMAFTLASEISDTIIKTEDIENKIFKPIFEISKKFKIGKEDRNLYITAIKEKIARIDDISRKTSLQAPKEQRIQLLSKAASEELVKKPNKLLRNKAIVYNTDLTISHLIIKTNGAIKNFYLSSQVQHNDFKDFFTQIIPQQQLGSPIKSPRNKAIILPDFCVADPDEILDKKILEHFMSLVGTNLQYPESQCKIAHNEFKGLKTFYIQQQKQCIDAIQVKLELKKEFPDYKEQYGDIDFINNTIIPYIKNSLETLSKQHAENEKMHMEKLLTNYAGYKSISGLARNYELIKKFEETTLKKWEEDGITGYKNNINNILSSIRPGKTAFGYHQGCFIYLTPSKRLKDTPSVIYHQTTKKILSLIVSTNEGNKQISAKSLPPEYVKRFNALIKQNVPDNDNTSKKIFLGHEHKLLKFMISNGMNTTKIINCPTAPSSEFSYTDVKSMDEGSVRKLVFKTPDQITGDKFLIMKKDGYVQVIHHLGGNRLYKPQDIIPLSKSMPTSLLLLGIGHFGDVKLAFLPSGEHKALKVVRAGSVKETAERLDHKDAWDEKEDDLKRELEGLGQTKNLITVGTTASHLRKLTKTKKELLNISKEAIPEQLQTIDHMAGTATHILMNLSGSKDLRQEVKEKKSFEYCLNRAIECCDILTKFHETGTHNDFKPANISITRTEKLEIIDFGTYQKDGISEVGKDLDPRVHGTPVFMHPASLVNIKTVLENSSKQIISNIIKSFKEVAFPTIPYTRSQIKKYYIQRRLYDVFASKKPLAIAKIEDIKQLIKDLISAKYSHTTKYAPQVPVNLKFSNQLKITEKLLDTRHYSAQKHKFKELGDIDIIWTIKEEIKFLIKAIQLEFNKQLRFTEQAITMGCDASYDVYSLVSSISGSCNKDAYLTNVILRYGELDPQDLLNLDGSEDICAIQDYAGEGQGLQLDKLFNDMTEENKLRFVELKNEWEELRNKVLLQTDGYKDVTPGDFKLILNKIKSNILDIPVPVETEDQQVESEVVEPSVSESEFFNLANSLKNDSKTAEDPIKFIFDLCAEHQLLDIRLLNQEQRSVAIGNLYRLLLDIVFPANPEATYEEIVKNRKLAAIIFLVFMPHNYDLSLSSLPEQMKQYLPENYQAAIKYIRQQDASLKFEVVSKYVEDPNQELVFSTTRRKQNIDTAHVSAQYTAPVFSATRQAQNVDTVHVSAQYTAPVFSTTRQERNVDTAHVSVQYTSPAVQQEFLPSGGPRSRGGMQPPQAGVPPAPTGGQSRDLIPFSESIERMKRFVLSR